MFSLLSLFLSLNLAEIPHIYFYLGAVAASILGALVLVWIIVAVRILIGGRGMVPILNNFFAAIVNNNYQAAYGMLTPEFQAQFSLKDFKEFVKKNGLRQYKRLELPLFEIRDDRCPLDLTIELTTGQTLLLDLDLVRIEKVWLIEGLALGQSSETDNSNQPGKPEV